MLEKTKIASLCLLAMTRTLIEEIRIIREIGEIGKILISLAP
jgi:hypothetical protein